MAYAVEWSPHADRALRQLPEDTQRVPVARAETLAVNPYPRGSIKLEGSADLHRLRVGAYRVLYRVERARLLLLVVDVLLRERGYRGR
jgi:mRNA interferase RelE/StbE